jgi:hypothetical protein
VQSIGSSTSSNHFEIYLSYLRSKRDSEDRELEISCVVKRENGAKTTQQNKGVKTCTIRVPPCVLELCLRRKRVEGRVYIHEWQSRVELRDDYGTHFPTTVGVRRNVVLTIIDGDISDARGHRV